MASTIGGSPTSLTPPPYRAHLQRRRLMLLVMGLTATGGASVHAQTALSEIASPATAAADPVVKPSETFAIHGQATFVDQGTFAFRSSYRGANSLDPGTRALETADVTLYVGLRPWSGAEIWVNPEIDQGFGLSNTFGAAGFPSGEAYKVGKSTPYLKLPRLFLRQTIDLGGDRAPVDADLNQLAGAQTANRLVFTIGKFSVTDVFDTNQYAHDPRHDFLNWTIADTGTFDYAADAWAYTYGLAAEWYQGRWTARAGVFNLSITPNSTTLEDNFSQYQVVAELEERHQLLQHPGKLAITGYWTRGRMGGFADAIRLAQEDGLPADITAVRRYQGRFGIGFNLEQAVGDDLGVFARAGVADGRLEAYEFTDVDRTLAAGLSLKGRRWRRSDDTIGAAVVVNGISKIHERFLNDGGLGILVGDGKLPHPGAEAIIETYYELAVAKPMQLTLDYQFIENPSYNRDRGPASVLAVRLHAQF